MSTICIAKRQRNGPLTRVLNLATFLHASAVRALRPFFAFTSRQRPWYALDERQLRDIGMTVVDAEIARLESRMGTTETLVGDFRIARR
jgi:glutathione S-transferase